METGDKCSYLLSVDSFAQGDMIELSAIDSYKIDLQLYHGGYSLSSSQHRTHLENGKKYLIDGSQKLFLMVDTVYFPFKGKPYFSLAMKKGERGALICFFAVMKSDKHTYIHKNKDIVKLES